LPTSVTPSGWDPGAETVLIIMEDVLLCAFVGGYTALRICNF
jgi:hypothetical protein